MTQDLKIKIFTRSFDLRLYRLSKGLYEDLGWPVVRLTDKSADGYFYSILKDSECDIAVNIDEDCFITNKEAVLALVDYVVENNIANAGCPDGGEWTPRSANPIVTNPFFNVLNLHLLREHCTKEQVKAFDYKAHLEELKARYPQEHIYEGRTPHLDWTTTEPYYPFFFTQAYYTKTLYLHSKRHQDGWTTILFTLSCMTPE